VDGLEKSACRKKIRSVGHTQTATTVLPTLSTRLQRELPTNSTSVVLPPHCIRVLSSFPCAHPNVRVHSTQARGRSMPAVVSLRSTGASLETIVNHVFFYQSSCWVRNECWLSSSGRSSRREHGPVQASVQYVLCLNLQTTHLSVRSPRPASSRAQLPPASPSSLGRATEQRASLQCGGDALDRAVREMPRAIRRKPIRHLRGFCTSAGVFLRCS